jgi:hypothetical protein
MMAVDDDAFEHPRRAHARARCRTASASAAFVLRAKALAFSARAVRRRASQRQRLHHAGGVHRQDTAVANIDELIDERREPPRRPRPPAPSAGVPDRRGRRAWRNVPQGGCAHETPVLLNFGQQTSLRVWQFCDMLNHDLVIIVSFGFKARINVCCCGLNSDNCVRYKYTQVIIIHL